VSIHPFGRLTVYRGCLPIAHTVRRGGTRQAGGERDGGVFGVGTLFEGDVFSRLLLPFAGQEPDRGTPPYMRKRIDFCREERWSV